MPSLRAGCSPSPLSPRLSACVWALRAAIDPSTAPVIHPPSRFAFLWLQSQRTNFLGSNFNSIPSSASIDHEPWRDGGPQAKRSSHVDAHAHDDDDGQRAGNRSSDGSRRRRRRSRTRPVVQPAATGAIAPPSSCARSCQCTCRHVLLCVIRIAHDPVAVHAWAAVARRCCRRRHRFARPRVSVAGCSRR